jgi:hypothetical protein
MSWHPLVLAIRLLDLIAWAIYAAAAWRLLTVLPHWQPQAAGDRQLRRERSLELVSYQAGWVAVLQAIGFVLLMVGVSNLWPSYVPGAMCGTGVLEAMGPAGEQALVFKGALLLLLYCRHTAERLDRTHPEILLAPLSGRLLLLAAPLMALGTWRFAVAVAGVDRQEPVNCCAALYEHIDTGGRWLPLAGPSTMPEGIWILACFGGALLVAVWGWRHYRRPGIVGNTASWLAAGLLAVWGVSVVMALKTVVAPYVYQVLYHPCPWCFFLVEHGAVGFVLFGVPAGIIAEGAAVLTARSVGFHRPALEEAARRRMAIAGLRIWLGALLFAFAAAAPMLWWRVRFGAWMQ